MPAPTGVDIRGVSPDAPVDWQFLDLVYADEDLVQAEFAALVAASWDGPGQPGPDGGSGAMSDADPGSPRVVGSPGVRLPFRNGPAI